MANGDDNALMPGGMGLGTPFESIPDATTPQMSMSPDLGLNPAMNRNYASIYRGNYNPLNPVGWAFALPAVDASTASASGPADPMPRIEDFASVGKPITPEQRENFNATMAAWQTRNPSGTSAPAVTGTGAPVPEPTLSGTSNALSPPAASYVPYTGPHPDIYNHAMYYGVDPELALTTARIESNFGQSPDRSGSQYKGVFQLGNDEWVSMGGTDANRGDRAAQVNLGVALISQRQQQLADAIGRTPTNAEVYLAHNQGVAGAKFLLENPNMNAAEAIVQATGGKISLNEARTRISGNAGNPDGTAGEFVSHWNDIYNHFKGQIGDVPTNAVAQVIPRIGTGTKYVGGSISAPGAASIPMPEVGVTAKAGGPSGGYEPPPKPNEIADATVRRSLMLQMLGQALKGMKLTPMQVGYDPFKVQQAGQNTSGPVDLRDRSLDLSPRQSPVQTRYLPAPQPIAGGGTNALMGGMRRSDPGAAIAQSRMYENLFT